MPGCTAVNVAAFESPRGRVSRTAASPGALQVGVQRRLDDQPVLLELLLGDPELLRHVLLHEVADVGADAGLDAAATRRRGRGEAERGGRRLGLLRRA